MAPAMVPIPARVPKLFASVALTVTVPLLVPDPLCPAR
jgi:hypothetical protein